MCFYKFFYRLLKIAIAPLVTSIYIKDIQNLDNLPKDKVFLVASSHVSYLDPLLLSCIFEANLKRRIYYLGKKGLFSSFFGRLFHNAVGTIPIEKGKKGKKALKIALDSIKNKKIIGIFPEGGRSFDGRLQRGKTGVARLALWARVPVVPSAIIGTFELYPRTKKFPKFKKSVVIKFGKPMYFNRYYNKRITKKILRDVTTPIMKQIAKLTSQKYNY